MAASGGILVFTEIKTNSVQARAYIASQSTSIEGSVQRLVASVRWSRRGALLFLFVAIVFITTFAQGEDNSPDSVDRGGQIFSQRCAMCHGEHGEGRSALVTIAGPSLRAEHDYGRVMTAVEVGPSHMPSFVYVLPVDEIRAVSHFVVDRIADIPLPAGDIGEGGRLFRMNCASCHRTAGRGGALGFIGTNAPDLTGKSAALIAGTIRWGPGPMPAFPPAVLDEHALASVVSYVRYAQHPERPGGLALTWYGPFPEGAVAWLFILGMIGVAVWIERGGKG